MAVKGIDLGKYQLGWHDSTDDYVYTPHKGLNTKTVEDISHGKSEPDWMLKFRLNALKNQDLATYQQQVQKLGGLLDQLAKARATEQGSTPSSSTSSTTTTTRAKSSGGTQAAGPSR